MEKGYIAHYSYDKTITFQEIIIRNRRGGYVNYCECERCISRIGTSDEHIIYDNAIPETELFETPYKLKIHIIRQLDDQVRKFTKEA